MTVKREDEKGRGDPASPRPVPGGRAELRLWATRPYRRGPIVPITATVRAKDPGTGTEQAAGAPARPAEEAPGWSSWPRLAQGLRIASVAVPVGVSVGVGFGVQALLPAPGGLGVAVAWWVVEVVAGLAALLVAERGARAILPLATLLSLSLVFPDQTPRRFGVALRASSPRAIRRRLEEVGPAPTGQAEVIELVLALVGALGRHDRLTRGHSERVRAYTDLIAAQMGLSGGNLDRLRWAALVHDVGKLEVSASILGKPGRPSDEEWQVLRRHPATGARLVQPLAAWLGPWAAAVGQHHEHYDGSGYPAGLSGSQISLGGRIVALADAYEVMTATRPYRRPVRPQAAREEVVRCAGTHFDPAVVRAFLGVSIGDLRRVMGPMALVAQIPLLSSAPRLEALVGMAGRQAAATVGTAAAAGVLATTGVSHLSAPATPGASPASHLAAAQSPGPVAAGTTPDAHLAAIDSRGGRGTGGTGTGGIPGVPSPGAAATRLWSSGAGGGRGGSNPAAAAAPATTLVAASAGPGTGADAATGSTATGSTATGSTGAGPSDPTPPSAGPTGAGAAREPAASSTTSGSPAGAGSTSPPASGTQLGVDVGPLQAGVSLTSPSPSGGGSLQVGAGVGPVQLGVGVGVTTPSSSGGGSLQVGADVGPVQAGVGVTTPSSSGSGSLQVGAGVGPVQVGVTTPPSSGSGSLEVGAGVGPVQVGVTVTPPEGTPPEGTDPLGLPELGINLGL
ncbi:MAG: HD domain-containing phosphohydrolase [Acidimicrobiales bacterium]